MGAPAHVGEAMVPVVMDCAIRRGVIQTIWLNRKKNFPFDIFWRKPAFGNESCFFWPCALAGPACKCTLFWLIILKKTVVMQRLVRSQKNQHQTTGQLLDNLHNSVFQYFMITPEVLFSEKREDLLEKNRIPDSFSERIPGKNARSGRWINLERESLLWLLLCRQVFPPDEKERCFFGLLCPKNNRH